MNFHISFLNYTIEKTERHVTFHIKHYITDDFKILPKHVLLSRTHTFLTFCVLVMGSVGQQWGSEDMHAVLVEKTQKFCLLSFLMEAGRKKRKPKIMNL